MCACSPRILQVRERLLDGRRERDEVVQGMCELQVEGHGERQDSGETSDGERHRHLAAKVSQPGGEPRGCTQPKVT